MTSSKFIFCFGLLFSLIVPAIQAQHAVPPSAEELLLELKVERELSFDFSAILDEGDLYLPMTKLCSMLGNRYAFQKEQLVFEVRIGQSERQVVLDLANYSIEGVNTDLRLTTHDFFIRGKELYLSKNVLEKLFGYTIIFDFRKLEIMLFAEQDLQVIKQKKRKERYRYFNSNQTVLEPDVKQGGDHQLFDGWIMDWTLSSSHMLSNQSFTYGSGLAGEVLGGDLSLHFTGSKKYGFHWNNTRGRWRYPVYSSSLLTQFTAGIQTAEDKTDGIQQSFKGINITNRPLSSRRMFDRYTISRPLKAGWDAGLEVNGRLRGVALAEESDRYNFKVPLTYGSNTITVNHFDREGYNHPRQYRIYIPQNLLPPNEFEYNLSMGRYSRTNNNFGKLNLKWGLSPHVTLGGGAQYVTSSPDHFLGGETVPFFQIWSRLGNAIYLDGEHTLNYLSRASMRVVFPNSQLLKFRFKKFHRPLGFGKINRSFDLSMTSSFPITLPFARINTSLSAQYFKNRASGGFMNLYGGVNTSLPAGFRLNIRSRGEFSNRNPGRLPTAQNLETQVSLSKRIFRKVLLRPEITYSHTREKIARSRLQVGGRFLDNGNLSFSINHDHIFHRTSLQLDFSIDLPFGRHSSHLRSNYSRPSFNQRTSGTIVFDVKGNQLTFDRRDWTNKAAITLNPYLDLNNNSTKDTGEPSVSGLKASVYRKGKNRPTYRNRKTVTQLAAYHKYTVHINSESLSNPLWSPKYEIYEVQPKPNQLTHINVPVIVQGEVSGKVEMAGANTSGELYGMEVRISSLKGTFDKVVRTYSGGEFYYVGLEPGRYIASLNKEQLSGQSLKAEKDSVGFVIQSRRKGDIVDGVRLKVSSDESKTKPLDKIYAIQVGAFRKKRNAVRHAELSQIKLGQQVSVVYDTEQHLYKCRIQNIQTRKYAEQILERIIDKPTSLYDDAFLIEVSVNSR